MRLLRLNTPILALIFSVCAEVVFFVAFKLFGTITEFGTLTNFWSRSFFWFHRPAGILTDFCVTLDNGSVWQDIVGFVIFFSVALIEWWLVVFTAICCIRQFTKRTA